MIDNSTQDPSLYVAGVGASAGGLEALANLFESMPVDIGIAFVVVQHLSPDFKSHMSELLSRKTQLGVHRVEDGMQVAANNIYLIPPNTEMVISHGRLLLTERSADQTLAHPINQFLRSLAVDFGRQSIAIILSGTGSDGSQAIFDINQQGGLVIVQDEASAQFDGMPMNAQATGAAHIVLSPEAIPDALRRYVSQKLSPEAIAEMDLPELGTGIGGIFKLLLETSGVDFSHYKGSTFRRRLQRRIDLRRLPGVEEYGEYLRNNPEEVSTLFIEMLIGVTQFFRDKEAFDVLAIKVIPELAEKARREERQLRIWVSACASGEEAYSLAILLDEYCVNTGQHLDYKIFATDIHDESLRHAASGLFSEQTIREISQFRKERYFVKEKNGYRVAKSLRNNILFAHHNILNDAPFIQLDLVACRNLLIYFQPNAQQKVLALFHFALRADGVMLLGPSETPGEIIDEFEVIDSRWRVYRKRRDVRLPIETRLPMNTLVRPVPRASASNSGGYSATKTGNDDGLLRTYDRLLEEHMPPSILVDEHLNVIHTFGGAEKFLTLRSGRPSIYLLDVIDDKLRTPLAGAIQQAIRDSSEVSYTGLKTSLAGRNSNLRLIINPIQDPRSSTTTVLITLLAAETTNTESAKSDSIDIDELTRERISSLESELRFTRENLQATIEEIETSNEELQATNEEMLASNEELQSTNEELQSVNEELFTVNTEHQAKIEELAQAHGDMDNLLAATRVGVVFLDKDLAIRRFTPEVARLFHLHEEDIGRPIHSFIHRIQYEKFDDDVLLVRNEDREIEREIVGPNALPYLIRIAPFRREAHVQGIVMTLIDVSSLRAAEADLSLFQHAMNVSSNGICIALAQDDLPISYVNKGFSDLTGYSAEEITGKNCRFLQGSDTDQQAVKRIKSALNKGESVNQIIRNYRKNGEAFWNDLTINPVRSRKGDVTHFVALQNDITELMEQRLTSAQSLARMRSMLNSTTEGIYGVDSAGKCIFCNRAALDILGYSSAAEVQGMNMHGLVSHHRQDGSVYPFEDSPIYKALSEATGVHVEDEIYWKADGESFLVEYSSDPIIEDGKASGAVIAFRDVTHRKANQEELERAKTNAELADQAKGEFIANMSHEIRTPLSAIMAYADLLTTSLEDEGSVDHSRAIKRNADHLLSIINDILDMSKIGANQLSIVQAPVSVRDLVADIESLMAIRGAEKGLDLRFEYASPVPPFICSDAKRLRQILINLLSNAIKFTSEGEVRLSVSADSEYIAFDVKDTGIGIADKVQKKLFEPFEQASPEITQEYGGTGLGLSICKRLAQQLDSEILVDSTEGVGSVFTLRVPIGEVENTTYIQPSDPTEHSSIGEQRIELDTAALENLRLEGHILVVDDHEDVLNSVAKILRRAGASVETAMHGAQALDKVSSRLAQEESEYDLILLDMHMPVLSGFQAVQQLRRRSYTGPVFAMTAGVLDSERQKCFDAGCDGYLSKPVDSNTLLITAGNILGTDRSAQDISLEIDETRILIVDDHEDASQALAQLLEVKSLKVAIANDSATAINLALEFQPTICLLDINMPDLSGEELLRRLVASFDRNRPVFVAVTGEVRARRIEQMLAAGFDHHLPKPVSLDSLNRLLEVIE